MAEVIPGYTIEQKVVTVANGDTDMNDEITAQSADGWLVNNIFISGANVIILFTRQVTS